MMQMFHYGSSQADVREELPRMSLAKSIYGNCPSMQDWESQASSLPDNLTHRVYLIEIGRSYPDFRTPLPETPRTLILDWRKRATRATFPPLLASFQHVVLEQWEFPSKGFHLRALLVCFMNQGAVGDAAIQDAESVVDTIVAAGLPASLDTAAMPEKPDSLGCGIAPLESLALLLESAKVPERAKAVSRVAWDMGRRRCADSRAYWDMAQHESHPIVLHCDSQFDIRGTSAPYAKRIAAMDDKLWQHGRELPAISTPESLLYLPCGDFDAAMELASRKEPQWLAMHFSDVAYWNDAREDPAKRNRFERLRGWLKGRKAKVVFYYADCLLTLANQYRTDLEEKLGDAAGRTQWEIFSLPAEIRERGLLETWNGRNFK